MSLYGCVRLKARLGVHITIVSGLCVMAAFTSAGVLAFVPWVVVLWSARHPNISRFLQILRGAWAIHPPPTHPLSHESCRTHRTSILRATHAHPHFCQKHWLLGFCVIWVCISSSSRTSSEERRQIEPSWSERIHITCIS